MKKNDYGGIEIENVPCSASKSYLIFKRIFDIIFSSIVILISSPFWLIIVLLIKLDSSGPALYRHKRVGKHGKFIYLYKFRTMVHDADNIDKYLSPEQLEEYLREFKLDDDPRITRMGKFLRKTSIDEVPQLLNVIGGTMSLIGPRPVTEKELEKFEDDLPVFLSITPGITGWWACHGRSCVVYKERVKLEVYYAKNCCFTLDAKCFFKTIVSVIKGEGAK